MRARIRAEFLSSGDWISDRGHPVQIRAVTRHHDRVEFTFERGGEVKRSSLTPSALVSVTRR